MSRRPSRVRGRRDGVRVDDAVAIDAAPAGSNLTGLVMDLEFVNATERRWAPPRAPTTHKTSQIRQNILQIGTYSLAT